MGDAELDVEPHVELDVVAATNMLLTTTATKPNITTAATTATTINNTIAITTKSIIATNTPVHAAATLADVDADVVVMDTERNREELSPKLKPGTHYGMVLTGLTLVWRVSVMAIK